MSASLLFSAINYDTWFQDWFDTEFYHTLYKNRNDAEAQQFIDNLVNTLQPKAGSRMLDLACGKGRHARMLALKGYNVEGVDLSQSSISAAKKFTGRNLKFSRHDMRHPFRINHFDYVFNFFTSFGYFRDEAENEMVIKAIADSLRPGGTAVIDYLNVAYGESKHEFNTTYEIDGITYRITKWHDQKRFYKRIQVETDRSQPFFLETVAKYRLEDFLKFFALHNLTLKSVYGDYQMQSYDVKKSPRLILVVEKTNA